MKFEHSEVVLRFMTMREPSKPITIHLAIKVADLISSHHIPSSGERLTRSPWGTMLWLLIVDGRCADTAVRRGRISFTKRNALKPGKALGPVKERINLVNVNVSSRFRKA